MEPALYVTLSAQIALEKRMTTLADNIANLNTVGFRATEIKFEEAMSEVGGDKISFVNEGEDYLLTSSGAMSHTGSMFDFAVDGDAWFAVETPSGQVLTRDGRFTMTAAGELVTLNGYPVLDAGGAPIQLDPLAGEPRAGSDGSLTQNGNAIGAIGLFSADLTGGYTRFENSGVIPATPAEPVVDRFDVGVLQGYVEESNVNPVAEMTRLIMVSRAFESANSLTSDTENHLNQAIKQLGSRS